MPEQPIQACTQNPSAIIDIKDGKIRTVKIKKRMLYQQCQDNYIYIDGLDPATLDGKTFKDRQGDGTIIIRARVGSCLNQHKKLIGRKFKIAYCQCQIEKKHNVKSSSKGTWNDTYRREGAAMGVKIHLST